MPTLVLENPVKLRLPEAWKDTSIEAQLRDELAYEDLGVTHEWRTWARAQKAVEQGRPHWFVAKFGKEALDAKVEELAAARMKSALFTAKDGSLYTYSGLAPRLSETYGADITRAYELPEHGLVPYDSKPFDSRWYQKQAEDVLVDMSHGAVELATGLGKSLIICKIFKRIGLPGIVIAPTLSIATQLLIDMTRLFGAKRVGKFFGGKKEADKMFVVAVSKSLTAVEPGSVLAKKLASKKVLIGDESHLLPAATLQKVVLRLLAAIPYRFFLSGTQMRGDGRDIVLEGITGKVAMHMDVRQGVNEGYLAKPNFVQFKVRSNLNLDVPDSIKMNRTHLHQNEEVYKHAGALISRALTSGRRPLVLVEEVTQFAMLLPFLKVQAGFAHGGVDAASKKKLPEAYHKSKPTELVAAFDDGSLPVLVGTSCIAVGTDIKTADFIVDIVGLASEVRLRQAVGRGTRMGNGKKSFSYVDYCVYNIPKLARHAEKRLKIMNDIYGPVKVVAA